MNDDDDLCLCFHVTKRKVKNFIRIENPKRVGQLSECYGAGTGCGWCRPFLAKLFELHRQQLTGNLQQPDIEQPPARKSNSQKTDAQQTDSLPDSQQYAMLRSKYVRDGGGKVPPGGTPTD